MYEPVFKLEYANVFITDLFLLAYKNFDQVTTIKNGKWEFFLSDEELKKTAEIGRNLALGVNSLESFKKRYQLFCEKLIELQKTNVEDLSNEEFIEFLENLKGFFKEFFETYRDTEFFYFTKIEKEIGDFIEDKWSFQDLLSGDVEVASWPEEKRRLADYIIGMQGLKFEYRKLLNDLAMGEKSILSKVLAKLVSITGREDATSMTFTEVVSAIKGEKVGDVSERHVYSFIKWGDNNNLDIISGGEGYRKIRELEKEIPKNEVIGNPACKGIVKGKVRIIPLSINPEQHLSKFQEGEVLVSSTTGPEMVVIMEKAAAIVTDEGGLMSHAAVVAREFGVPCVVGTKYATEVFKDGDLVEVNANNGIVKKL